MDDGHLREGGEFLPEGRALIPLAREDAPHDDQPVGLVPPVVGLGQGRVVAKTSPPLG